MSDPFPPILSRCADTVGGMANLAAALGLTRQAVYYWRIGIPVRRVVDVERVTGIPRRELRPDVFGDAQ